MLMKDSWERARDLGPGTLTRATGGGVQGGQETGGGRGSRGPARREVPSAPREEPTTAGTTCPLVQLDWRRQRPPQPPREQGVTCLPYAQAQAPLVFMRRGTLSCLHRVPLRAGRCLFHQAALHTSAPREPAQDEGSHVAAVPAAVCAVLAEQVRAPWAGWSGVDVLLSIVRTERGGSHRPVSCPGLSQEAVCTVPWF